MVRRVSEVEVKRLTLNDLAERFGALELDRNKKVVSKEAPTPFAVESIEGFKTIRYHATNQEGEVAEIVVYELNNDFDMIGEPVLAVVGGAFIVTLLKNMDNENFEPFACVLQKEPSGKGSYQW